MAGNENLIMATNPPVVVETDVPIQDAYIFDGFVVDDTDDIAADMSPHTQINETNIVAGKRRRKQPKRYMDADYASLMLDDIPDDELNAVLMIEETNVPFQFSSSSGSSGSDERHGNVDDDDEDFDENLFDDTNMDVSSDDSGDDGGSDDDDDCSDSELCGASPP